MQSETVCKICGGNHSTGTCTEKPKKVEWWTSDGDRISAPYATILLGRILDQPHARAYLGITDDEILNLHHTISDKMMNIASMNLAAATAPSEKRFRELLERLMDLPKSEPHLVIPDIKHEGRVYLVLGDQKERLAEKSDGGYFLLHELKSSAETVAEIETRIQQLSTSKYFPKFKIVHDEQSTYLGVEFVAGGYPQKGVDVSAFIAFCKEIDFEPDTNVTNFKTGSDGNLKYIDIDAIEWLIDPSSHPFKENSYAGRDKIW